MEPAEEGSPAEELRVPEGQVAFLQFLEPELPPPDELVREVQAHVGKDPVSMKVQVREKKTGGEKKQEQDRRETFERPLSMRK